MRNDQPAASATNGASVLVASDSVTLSRSHGWPSFTARDNARHHAKAIVLVSLPTDPA